MRVMFARLLLVAVPFLIWFAYRWWVKRRGLAIPDTPYAWLFLAGVGLMTGSLFLTALAGPDHRNQTYTPAQALPDGRVVPERYE